MIDQCRAKVLTEHLPFFDLLEKYEQHLTELLGQYVIALTQPGELHQEMVLKQWDAYIAEYFSPTIEFNALTMDMHMYLVLQFYQAMQTVDEIVDKLEEVREILRVSKFWIEYLSDPPSASVDYYMRNYRNYRKCRGGDLSCPR